MPSFTMLRSSTSVGKRQSLKPHSPCALTAFWKPTLLLVTLLLIVRLLGDSIAVTTEPAGIPAPLTASPTATVPNRAAEVIVGDPLVIVDKIGVDKSNGPPTNNSIGEPELGASISAWVGLEKRPVAGSYFCANKVLS